MRRIRLLRTVQALATGIIMVQMAGCDTLTFLQFVQTVFLGITAAGSIAILQNI